MATHKPAFQQIASGLRFPEGPVAMPDGSVILTEMFGHQLTRVAPDVIRYEATVTDPDTWAAPWTVAFPLHRDPRYLMAEYASTAAGRGLEVVVAERTDRDFLDRVRHGSPPYSSLMKVIQAGWRTKPNFSLIASMMASVMLLPSAAKVPL